jgi:hypothetical protein
MHLTGGLNTETIGKMSPGAIRNAYILYIGAGAVAAGGFIALGRSIPTIASAFRSGLADLLPGNGPRATVIRTERDLPITVVIGGAAAISLAIWLTPILEINFLTALLVILFGFFFVTVSSRITGEIGSSSNPISGMTIATLLLTCGLFVLLGWTGVDYKAMALTTAALVCVAASNGGTISQDLKTGFLVGATPRLQQISILVGVVTSAVVIGFTLLMLNDSRTTFPAVSYPEFTAASVSDQTMAGPDGKNYRVAYLREEPVLADDKRIPRGKYLVDDTGKLSYLVDPGVSGSYPFKLEKSTGALSPDITVNAKDELVRSGTGATVGMNRGTELGIDHHPYRLIELTDEVNQLRPGRYLLDANNQVAYMARPLEKFDAPKAQLFRLIIDGTLGGDLPWGLVLVGVLLAIILELVGVSSLPFAVGLYLPIYTSGGIFVGGAVRWLVDRRRREENASEAEFSPGMLMASGLIAGGAITGVLQSVIYTMQWDRALDLSGYLPASIVSNGTWWPMTPFLAMAAGLFYIATQKRK